MVDGCNSVDDTYIYACLGLTVVQVFGLTVVQVEVKTLRQMILRDYRRERPLCGLPNRNWPYTLIGFMVAWQSGSSGCSYCGLKPSDEGSFEIVIVRDRFASYPMELAFYPLGFMVA